MPAQSQQADCRLLFDRHRVWIMGVLNVTPDSFYAGARVMGIEPSLAHARTLLRQGADVVDVGAESTRPGAAPVPLAAELERLLPVVSTLHREFPQLLISVDTRKAEVARQAFRAGACMLNDVSALCQDPEMAAVAADARVPVVLMHMRGTPQTMQHDPRYRDVVKEIESFFEERMTYAVRAGIADSNLILDPGIGFGKTLEHNVTILRSLDRFKRLGRPLLVGLSRKKFLGRLSSAEPAVLLPPEERLEASLAAGLWAVARGANGLRVHDVEATGRAVRTWRALEAGAAP